MDKLTILDNSSQQPSRDEEIRAHLSLAFDLLRSIYIHFGIANNADMIIANDTHCDTEDEFASLTNTLREKIQILKCIYSARSAALLQMYDTFSDEQKNTMRSILDADIALMMSLEEAFDAIPTCSRHEVIRLISFASDRMFIEMHSIGGTLDGLEAYNRYKLFPKRISSSARNALFALRSASMQNGMLITQVPVKFDRTPFTLRNMQKAMKAYRHVKPLIISHNAPEDIQNHVFADGRLTAWAFIDNIDSVHLNNLPGAEPDLAIAIAWLLCASQEKIARIPRRPIALKTLGLDGAPLCVYIQEDDQIIICSSNELPGTIIHSACLKFD